MFKIVIVQNDFNFSLLRNLYAKNTELSDRLLLKINTSLIRKHYCYKGVLNGGYLLVVFGV